MRTRQQADLSAGELARNLSFIRIKQMEESGVFHQLKLFLFLVNEGGAELEVGNIVDLK